VFNFIIHSSLSPPLSLYQFDRKEGFPTKQKAITEVTAFKGMGRKERKQMAKFLLD